MPSVPWIHMNTHKSCRIHSSKISFPELLRHTLKTHFEKGRWEWCSFIGCHGDAINLFHFSVPLVTSYRRIASSLLQLSGLIDRKKICGETNTWDMKYDCCALRFFSVCHWWRTNLDHRGQRHPWSSKGQHIICSKGWSSMESTGWVMRWGGFWASLCVQTAPSSQPLVRAVRFTDFGK